jgi:Mg-chelatase subunit ChlI
MNKQIYHQVLQIRAHCALAALITECSAEEVKEVLANVLKNRKSEDPMRDIGIQEATIAAVVAEQFAYQGPPEPTEIKGKCKSQKTKKPKGSGPPAKQKQTPDRSSRSDESAGGDGKSFSA